MEGPGGADRRRFAADPAEADQPVGSIGLGGIHPLLHTRQYSSNEIIKGNRACKMDMLACTRSKRWCACVCVVSTPDPPPPRRLSSAGPTALGACALPSIGALFYPRVCSACSEYISTSPCASRTSTRSAIGRAADRLHRQFASPQRLRAPSSHGSAVEPVRVRTVLSCLDFPLTALASPACQSCLPRALHVRRPAESCDLPTDALRRTRTELQVREEPRVNPLMMLDTCTIASVGLALTIVHPLLPAC